MNVQPIVRTITEIVGMGICILLPLWFNPFSQAPFEPAKVALFQNLTCVGALTATVSLMGSKNHARPAQMEYGIKSFRRSNPLIPSILLFAIANILATLTSADWNMSLWGSGESPHGLVMVICCLIFFWLMTNVLVSKETAERFIDVLLFASIPVSVYGLVQYVAWDPLTWVANPVSPVFSTLGNPNLLGAYLAMVAPFTLSRIVIASNRHTRLRYGFVGLMQMGCLWLTLARGAWLGLIGGCVTFFLLVGWCWQKRILVRTSLIGLLIGTALFIGINTGIPNLLPHRVATLAKEEKSLPPKIDTASMQARMIIWSNTVDLVTRRWLLGYGPDTFEQIYEMHFPSSLEEIEGEVRVDDPHNIILRLLVDSGVGGLLGFGWIVVAFYRLVHIGLTHHKDRQTQALLVALASSMVAFLIQAQFNAVVIVHLMLFWLNVALAVRLVNSPRYALGKGIRECPNEYSGLAR